MKKIKMCCIHSHVTILAIQVCSTSVVSRECYIANNRQNTPSVLPYFWFYELTERSPDWPSGSTFNFGQSQFSGRVYLVGYRAAHVRNLSRLRTPR